MLKLRERKAKSSLEKIPRGMETPVLSPQFPRTRPYTTILPSITTGKRTPNLMIRTVHKVPVQRAAGKRNHPTDQARNALFKLHTLYLKENGREADFNINQDRLNAYIEECLVHYFGKQSNPVLVAAGEYGSAWRVSVTTSVLNTLRDWSTSSPAANHGLSAVVSTGEIPQLGRNIIIKVQVAMPNIWYRRPANANVNVNVNKKGIKKNYIAGAWYKTFLKDALRESKVHAILTGLGGSGTSTVCGQSARASDVVPRLYVAGMSLGEGLFYTAMSEALGTTLKKLSESRHVNWREPRGEGLNALEYSRVERALALVWLAGFAHCDAHVGNIMISENSSAPVVTLIDFGMAVVLPAKVRLAISSAIDRILAAGSAGSFGTVWASAGANAHVRSIYMRKGFEWMNGEGKVLLTLYRMLSMEERARLPGVRAQLYGCRNNFKVRFWRRGPPLKPTIRRKT